MTITEGQYLSPTDLAEELDVPLRTVYGWIHKGTAPRSFKIGKHRRFRRTDVDEWLEAHADEPRAPV